VADEWLNELHAVAVDLVVAQVNAVAGNAYDPFHQEKTRFALATRTQQFRRGETSR